MTSDRVTEEVGPRAPSLPEVRPPTASPPAPRELGAASVEAQDHAATLLRYRVGFGYAIVVYAVFFLSDIFLVSFVAPGRLWAYALLRFSGVFLAAWFWWRLTQSPPLTPRVFRWLDLGIYSYASACITLMALESGGLTSIYISGIETMIVCRGATQAEQWRRGVVSIGVPIGVHFLTLVPATPFSPTLQAQWGSTEDLAIFAAMTAFLMATAFFIVFAGHGTWALRQQVFEARRLGRYRLIQPIGEGGMGQVWIAAHSTLRRNVAVKVMRGERVRDPILAAARFEREVRATTELTHPNTVRIYDYGVTEDGLSYYAMELLAGHNLRHAVAREGPFAATRAIHIAAQAARSLAEAHAHGIIHRDVKPENIILCELGGERDFVKVIDFGIAHLRSADGEGLTRTGIAIGTPAFMAPEVRAGAAPEETADIYALGGVLAFLLTGHDPITQAGPVAIAGIDESLADVVGRALAPHPAARYQSMNQLITALDGARHAPGRPVPA